jgi:hypothetical protein
LLWFSGVLVLVVLLFGASRLWGDAVRGWLLAYPAVQRLFTARLALISLAATWAAVREPRAGALVPLCLCLVTTWNLLELRMGALLGSVLLVLGGIAMSARPWPNRVIMARCVAIAGLAVAIWTAAGR